MNFYPNPSGLKSQKNLFSVPLYIQKNSKKNPLFEARYHFTARGARINFHSNPAMFKAYGAFNNNTSIKKKKIAVMTVGRTFLQRQQSVDLFLTAIKSQPTCHPY
jgi:hypothetical protein